MNQTLVKKKYANQGRRRANRWVFGLVQRGTTKIFMILVADRTRLTLEPIIQALCEIQAEVVSDMWRAYNNLAALGFRHRMVNHSYNFVDRQTGNHTQTIEGAWMHCKKEWKKQCLAKDDLPLFLAYYCFIKNYCPPENVAQHYYIICRAIAEYWEQTDVY